MAGFCTLPTDASLVRGLLTSVDCNVQTMSEIGYRTISGPNSQVGLALTALMTIYVAVLGLRLLLGLSPLRIGEVTLTALKLAVVLALATSWPTALTRWRTPNGVARDNAVTEQPSPSTHLVATWCTTRYIIYGM